LVDWLPIEAVVKALQAAIQARNQLIQDVFQLTGISDILRGQTDPNETLGAQELKAQTGSRRQKNIKDDIARWGKDMALLNAEVIAEKFEPQSIAEITGFKYVPTPPMQPMLMLPRPGAPMGMPTPGMSPMGQPAPGMMPMPSPMQPQQPNPMMGNNGGPPMDDEDDSLTFGDEVMALLRNDKMRSFRIDVETDQTGQADENLEKQRRTELLNVVGGFMQKSVEVVAQVPEFGPVIKEMLMIAMRGFKTGKTLEDTLERGFKQAMASAQAARQQAQQQGDPKLIEAKAEHALKVETAKADMQLSQQKQQGDMQLAARKQQADTQSQMHKHQLDASARTEAARTDAQLATQKQQTDAMLEVRKQDLDAQAEHRQQNLAAAARARENAEKLLDSRQSGTVQ
jgi:hypothetical protein